MTTNSITKEVHIFRLSLSFRSIDAGTTIIVVSEDGSIVYIMDAEDHWLREFKSGEAVIYVEGHYDLLDNNIYLGARVGDQNW